VALTSGYEEGEGMQIGWSGGWKRKSVVVLAGGHEEGRRDVQWGLDTKFQKIIYTSTTAMGRSGRHYN
jgi:hypothetical protein